MFSLELLFLADKLKIFRDLAVLAIWTACWVAPVAAHAQSSDTGDLFQSVKPQVAVEVRKHPIGSDLVTVTALDPNYPADLLRKQVDALCGELNQPPRGLQIYTASFGGGHNLDFLKASFGTVGLIEGNGHFNVGCAARAFAGAPAPFTVTGLLVIFNDQKPTGDTVRSYNDSAVGVLARENAGPEPGVEYVIQLKTQDAHAIAIPDHYEPAAPAQAPPPAPQSPPDWSLWIALALGALSIGALVYLALLRLPPEGSETRPRSNNK